MPSTFICAHCSKEYALSPRCKTQSYCGSHTCQAARKQQWRRQKIKNDPQYQADQKLSQKKWLTCHQDYWRQYRKNNPLKMQANRNRQKLRDQCRRLNRDLDKPANLAKSDASTLKGPKMLEIKQMISEVTEYWLIPITAKNLAKSDALKVKLEVITPH